MGSKEGNFLIPRTSLRSPSFFGPATLAAALMSVKFAFELIVYLEHFNLGGVHLTLGLHPNPLPLS